MKLTPYEGVDAYIFGSKQAHINKAIGKAPVVEKDDIMEEIREIRGNITCTYIEKKLADVIIVKEGELQIGDIDIFNDADAVAKLEQTYTAIRNSKRTHVLFAELGLCLGGFTGKKVPEGRIAICFARERLDFYEIYLEM
ncbi:hypothetical protein SK066_12010 [Paenibacillus hunanensis]|uniref:hypothetical protein n=1 Tax=Paenibacillus hunanensis TaxID=539262 RepID=UPI002A6A338D|nr:hypothetical protein [Paenibacillus hunanensis]WPP39367.1 hypothetical protein SK066_12010 [Paenibacillus hunanensis]